MGLVPEGGQKGTSTVFTKVPNGAHYGGLVLELLPMADSLFAGEKDQNTNKNLTLSSPSGNGLRVVDDQDDDEEEEKEREEEKKSFLDLERARHTPLSVEIPRTLTTEPDQHFSAELAEIETLNISDTLTTTQAPRSPPPIKHQFVGSTKRLEVMKRLLDKTARKDPKKKEKEKEKEKEREKETEKNKVNLANAWA